MSNIITIGVECVLLKGRWRVHACIRARAREKKSAVCMYVCMYDYHIAASIKALAPFEM